MRAPIPLVVFLCLAVISGVWWYHTREMDFLTPPPESRLEAIRAQVAASSMPADGVYDAGLAATETTVKEPPPPINLGNLDLPPVLEEYSDFTPRSGSSLIDLAERLEGMGEFQRALLAWERVIDLARADAAQSKTAVAAIQRLRPTLPDWNSDPSRAIPVVLHAGTAQGNVAALEPALAQAALEIEKASAGILKVSPKITAGPDPPASSASPPVALWLAGPDETSSSTDVISFTVGELETLPSEVLKTSFALIRGFLGRSNSFNPPPPALSDEEGGDTVAALHSHITRLSWQNLGRLLNHPAP